MAIETTVTQPAPVLIIAMGVSGTGKSTLGAALAAALNMPYIDGDDLHPRANIDKMAAGCPLTDADREPWLREIRKTAERVTQEQKQHKGRAQNGTTANGNGKATGTPGVVIACSALKRAYRDVLRGVDVGTGDSNATERAPADSLSTYFVFIEGSREVLMDRMLKRSGHFMKATMLDSQLNTLENPTGEEGVVVVSMEDSTATQVEKAMAALKASFDARG
ncbi:Gluconokinase [Mycena sanguinolenta]|uniref:gluconokinase n=1 Tax=Mycena sanguinolenta TaxID=230812 RepID=A0A8H6ZCB1_9AGAR|nr:Gluconokinase [Mycena sanguinolenta]